MIILSVSKLANNFSAGTNINIPKFVKYLSKICDSGYLDCGEVKLIKFEGFSNYFNLSNYKKISDLPKPFNKPDIVVFQNFYNINFIKIAKELKKHKIPYTIIPRSAMTKEAQNNKKLKKKIGNILFFNKLVRNAQFIHFLTENEYLESKKSFKFKSHVIVGNGIEMPQNHYCVKNRKEFIISYIGRYNIYHKGLDILINCIKNNYEWFRDKNIKFKFYGFNSDSGYDYLNNYNSRYNLKNIVELNDTVFGEEKEKAFLNSDVFIHTSRLEGHPTSVIEAISYGIPVIVTPGTNVANDVSKYQLGFTTKLDPEAIFNCIKDAYNNKDKFKQISENEIKYAEANFNWKIIANKIVDEYNSKIT